MAIGPLFAVCVSALAAVLARPQDSAAHRAEPDWTAMVRDQAASVHWIDANTLLLLPSHEDMPVIEVDVRTGARRTSQVPQDGRAAPFGATPLRSTGQGPSTTIRFVNRTEVALTLHWIDARGHEHDYGTLAPGQERAQHTYAGHAWKVRARDGGTLGYARAEPRPTRIIVSGPAAPEPSAGAPAGPQPHPHGAGVAAGSASGPAPALPAAAAALAGPFEWSPGHAHVIAWECTPAQEHPVHLIESSPRDQVQPKVRTINYLKPGDRIAQRWPRLFAADGTETVLDRALFANPWTIDESRWSDDGSTFYFRYNQRGHASLRLCAVEAATGRVRTVVEDEARTFVDYAHKGWLHWLSDRELLWMSERDGWNHIYLIDAANGAVVRQVTAGAWNVREVTAVDPAGRELELVVMGIDPTQDPYHRHMIRVSIDTGALTRLTQGDGTHTLDWSPDRRHYVDTWSRIDQPEVHELRRASDGSMVAELAKADISELTRAGWTMPERFVAKGRDGTTDIWGAIWRPVGTLGDSTPRAVVECIYAGPQDFFVPKAFSAWHGQRDLTREGFVTVQVDGMGTNWRGKKFHDVAWKNLKDSGLPDHVAWLRAAAAARPEIDLTRVGIFGGSAGGQSAMRALLDYPDLYRVGVADCGCHDNRMDKIWWNELWMGWPVDESYERCSNVTDAHKLQGKLMLIVGELDENVDPASTMQVAAALARAGKDFELVVVPGAGHGAAGTPFGARKQRDFLVRHLRAH